MSGSFRLGADGIYRCQVFEQFTWQAHGFGTRSANPPAPITLRQIHSNLVLNASRLGDREREGDALVTNEPGAAIGIRTADCVPILLLDPRARAVAAVHAGWRGTAAQIASRVVERMQRDFDTHPEDVYAAIGPCIRACCYEIGRDVAAHFENSGALELASEGSQTLNLARLNRTHLETVGVNPALIFDSGLCTACPGSAFFSYRREPHNPERMLASICRLW